MATPSVEPVTASALPAFAEFLHTNLLRSRSAYDWEVGLRRQWTPQPPNYGFMLRLPDGVIVGGIGAYYADRLIEGNLERFCNITSWCVLDKYRQLSMKLAMALIRQPDYHFTDFSPTKVVGATLKFFKFKELDDRQAVILNVPALPFDGRFVLHRPQDIVLALSDQALQIYRDHSAFPWLQHVLIGRSGHWCHAIYKRESYKGLGSAHVKYLSDPVAFRSGFGRFARFLLMRGMVSTHVECRMAAGLPWHSIVRSGFNRKVFLSPTLDDRQIDYLYSEQMVLDL